MVVNRTNDPAFVVKIALQTTTVVCLSRIALLPTTDWTADYSAWP